VHRCWLTLAIQAAMTDSESEDDDLDSDGGPEPVRPNLAATLTRAVLLAAVFTLAAYYAAGGIIDWVSPR